MLWTQRTPQKMRIFVRTQTKHENPVPSGQLLHEGLVKVSPLSPLAGLAEPGWVSLKIPLPWSPGTPLQTYQRVFCEKAICHLTGVHARHKLLKGPSLSLQRTCATLPTGLKKEKIICVAHSAQAAPLPVLELESFCALLSPA